MHCRADNLYIQTDYILTTSVQGSLCRWKMIMVCDEDYVQQIACFIDKINGTLSKVRGRGELYVISA
jgi:hypothetical protein